MVHEALDLDAGEIMICAKRNSVVLPLRVHRDKVGWPTFFRVVSQRRFLLWRGRVIHKAERSST
jgi:hypothetical protein